MLCYNSRAIWLVCLCVVHYRTVSLFSFWITLYGNHSCFTHLWIFREREAAKDAEDRLREQEELEELKNKIYSNPTVKDPDAEYQRRVREHEQEFLPPGAKKAAIEKERAPPSPDVIHQPPSPSPDRDGGMSPGGGGGSDYDDGYDNGNGADMGEPSPEMPSAPEPMINPISLPGTKIETNSKRRLKVGFFLITFKHWNNA